MQDSSLFSIRCKESLVKLKEPQVMGILNVTPDSFYASSRLQTQHHLLKQAERMLNEGASFLDVGGYSSRPGADFVSEDEEKRRVLPAIEQLIRNFPGIKISVDTFRSNVAREAVAIGACMINDISGGEADQNMLDVVAKTQVAYILMHMRGTPSTMQQLTHYEPDIITEINRFFANKIKDLHARNVSDVILDPGFGFAKTLEQNYFLLKHLELFKFHRKPLLVGISRKSMIYKLLKIQPEEALNGTTAIHALALIKGANILRVHDVKQAREVISIVKQLDKATSG